MKGSRLRPLSTLAFTFVLLFVPGCKTGSDYKPHKPNIIFILVDTLRADHLQLYGHPYKTAPFLAEWAEKGFVLDQAYSQAPWTKTSIPSLFTSRYVTSFKSKMDPKNKNRMNLKKKPEGEKKGGMGGKRRMGGKGGRGGMGERGGRHMMNFIINSRAVTFAEVFEQNGYQTAAFVGNPLVDPDFGFSQGFQTFKSIKSHGAEDINNSFFEWLSEIDTKRPFFAYLHYMEPHAPYNPPQPFQDTMLEYYKNKPPRLLNDDEFKRISGNGRKNPISSRNLNDFEAGYDAEIRLWDSIFEDFWSSIVQKGLDGNLLVIFTSDHGEGFFEHGKPGHGNTLHRELLKVPLILYMPGKISPGRSAHRVALMDLAPTILEIVGLKRPQGFQGRSFVPLLKGKSMSERPIVSELGVQSHGYQVAVIKDGYKWIYNNIFEIVTDVYSIEKDSGEKINLVPEMDPAKLDEMAEWFKSFLEEQRNNQSPPLDPDAVPKLDDEKIKQLKYLGYIK